MSKLLSKSLIILLIGVALVSCEKDPPEAPPVISPEDLVISINENSSFNQRNFKISFEQLFTSYNSWMTNYSHENNQYSKINFSYMNYNVYGVLGDKNQKFKHFYNDFGVITHSIRTSIEPRSAELIYEYEYDKVGLINKLSVKREAEIIDVLYYEYNDKYQLVMKIFTKIPEDLDSLFSTYEYDSQDRLTVFGHEFDKYQLNYTENLVSEVLDFNEDGTYLRGTIEYDDHSRIIRIEDDGEDNFSGIIQYGDKELIQHFYENEKLVSIYTLEAGLFIRSESDYKYNDGAFDHCIKRELDDRGFAQEKNCYTGNVQSMDLIGTSIIIDNQSGLIRIAQEWYYDNEGNEKYYAEYTLTEQESGSGCSVSNINWFLPDGSSIDASEISETWVMKLSLH